MFDNDKYVIYNIFIMEDKKKLILIVSLLLITGFLATSFVSFFVSRSSLRSQITYNELPLTSDNIYSEIQRDLLSPIFISSIMASDTFVRDWIIDGEKDPGKMIKYLEEIKDKYSTLTSFFVSENTKIYYQSKGILKVIKENDERDKWYFRVRNMDTLYEINVDPDMANKDTMTIFTNYKVFDYNNNYIGAIGVGLTVSAVKQLIENYKQKYNCNIFFIDLEGNIKLHGTDFPDKINKISNIEGLSNYSSKILNSDTNKFKYEKTMKLYM